MRCIGKKTFTLTSGAAVGISLADYVQGGLYAQGAKFTFTGGNVRVWFDGTDPTPTEGHLYYAGSSLDLDNSNDIANVRLISETGDVEVTYSLWR